MIDLLIRQYFLRVWYEIITSLLCLSLSIYMFVIILILFHIVYLCLSLFRGFAYHYSYNSYQVPMKSIYSCDLCNLWNEKFCLFVSVSVLSRILFYEMEGFTYHNKLVVFVSVGCEEANRRPMILWKHPEDTIEKQRK